MTDRPGTDGPGPAPAGSESQVFFQGDDRLEGMLGWPDASEEGSAAAEGVVPRNVAGGVVVAHPYPPHGATMDLPVVYRIAKSCRQRRFATLRFNFRSVGGSLGGFSGTEEHRDVGAAVAFLAGQLAGAGDKPAAGSGTTGFGTPVSGLEVPGPDLKLPLGLAGYSFGSIMSARVAAALPAVKALALVGFVVEWEHLPADTLDRLAGFRGPVLAVCAENDDIGPPVAVARELTRLGLEFTLEVVKGAGHFLEGRHREVGESVAAFFGEFLGVDAWLGQDYSG
jgi:alpha/beta superfamily hydrolase